MIVLDASAVVAWLLNEPDFPNSQFEATILKQQVLVPAHWSTEVGNALLLGLRRKRIEQERLIRALEDLTLLDKETQPAIRVDDILAITEFAEDHRLTFYDAVYVDLAFRSSASLATLDDAMRRAARKLDLPLFPNDQ